MDIQIIQQDTLPAGKYFEATCGKTSAYVWFSNSFGTVSVCCNNASHRAWGKLGRSFKSVEEALAAYKSPEMKAIIQAAAGA